MKKEDVSSLVVYMLIIAVAIIYSFTVLRTHYEISSFSSPIKYAGFIILALLAGIISAGLLLELGHIIGAKAGKYEIVSVCVLYFMFYKDNEKWKFKFSSFDGLTGETKTKPKDDKANPKAYLLLPTLFLSLWAIGCFIIFALLDTKGTNLKDIGYFFLTVMVVVLICLIYNLLPLKLDTKTDGYGLRMLSNSKNKNAYNDMLRVEEEVSNGNNDVEIKTFGAEDLTNYTAELNMNKVYVLLDKQEYEEADKILNIVLENKDKVSSKIYLRSLAMKIFNKAITSTSEEAIKYLDSAVDLNLRRELFDDGSFAAVRAYLLVEALVDQSKSECLLIMKKVNSAYKKVKPNRRLTEAKMYNDAIDYVCKVHPKWEFEQYKIDLANIK